VVMGLVRTRLTPTLATAFAVVGCLLMAGCDTYLLPGAGPYSAIVKSQVTWNGPPYGYVKLTPKVIDTLKEYGPHSLMGVFGDRRPPPEIKFGIGDVVAVTIFEAAAGGLFIPAEAGVRSGNFVNLPNQPVDTKGFISVPYAGLVPTAGKTPSQVEQEIVDRIKNRAIEPQAVVSLVTQNTSLITRAGGIKDQGQDLWVVVDRHGQRAAVPFGSIIYNPANNIWVWPDDTIYVYKEPQTYLAFGATGTQGQFQFSSGPQASAWRMTLAEGVGAAAGLLDTQADPGSVFLFRREPRELAELLGVDCSKMTGPTVPVVYSVSFADPAGYFLASQFQMHNKDVIFVADSVSVEITKFATFVDTLATAATDITAVGDNIETWRVASHTR
jgi:polysaccharide biosynthesis/export protein